MDVRNNSVPMAAAGFRGGSDARQFARAIAGVAFDAEGYRSAD